MAIKKSGLGKGYDALFVENSEDISEMPSAVLPIGEIEPDASQPRKSFDDEALSELAASIAEHGILQPLLVRPVTDGGYMIVAGERRYRAARLAGLREVPVIIKTLSDEQAAAIALIENLQREDLNAIEQAQGIRRLMDEFGFTQEQAAERLSKSRPAVANSLRLLSLPEDLIEEVRGGFLSAGHARALLGLESKDDMSTVGRSVIDKNLSVRDTEKLVKALNNPPKTPSAKKETTSVFAQETALALAQTLGRSVRITPGKKSGGVIEFEYFDEDDLRKLAKRFEE